jgi:hypothetical protein
VGCPEAAALKWAPIRDDGQSLLFRIRAEILSLGQDAYRTVRCPAVVREGCKRGVHLILALHNIQPHILFWVALQAERRRKLLCSLSLSESPHPSFIWSMQNSTLCRLMYVAHCSHSAVQPPGWNHAACPPPYAFQASAKTAESSGQCPGAHAAQPPDQAPCGALCAESLHVRSHSRSPV